VSARTPRQNARSPGDMGHGLTSRIRIWALRRPKAMDERKITHVLSMVKFDPKGVHSEMRSTTWDEYGKKYKHMMVDIDDVEDADILVHFPSAIRFIEDGLYPPQPAPAISAGEPEDAAVTTVASAPPDDTDPESHVEDATSPIPKFAQLKLKPVSDRKTPNAPTGAVYVHCAMGKSRSVSIIVAYLLWKYPGRFGRSAASSANPKPDKARARAAVEAAVKWVKNTREIAEPNRGFIRQLEMWWDMGCPDDVEKHPIYRRWVYKREVDESIACGRAPERLRFEDEEQDVAGNGGVVPVPSRELRCKRCRRVLANSNFILEHEQPARAPAVAKRDGCPHIFIEPLSWMRPTLEVGELDGRLACPNEKCGAIIGRYSWKGFKCSCTGWVTPAFSVLKSKVDELAIRSAAGNVDPTALGIRMPPGAESARQENL
jgi:dual specificity phosphatase 12